MIEMFKSWYNRRFTDPQAMGLAAILPFIFSAILLRRCWWRLCWPIYWNGRYAY